MLSKRFLSEEKGDIGVQKQDSIPTVGLGVIVLANLARI